MLSRKQQVLKRLFDLFISVLLLVFVCIPLVLLLVLASLDTAKMGLFVQRRIGQYGSPFNLYKIRSLRSENHSDVLAIKKSETRLGAWLRRTKLDELPQLLNVIRGEMSLVGPRPDVAGYADCLEGEDRIILKVKPGLTGPATLKYKNEDNLLLQQDNPNAYNDTVIWPDKIKINKAYILNWSLKKDLYYLWVSVVGITNESKKID